jgi:hypothetical protein
MKKEENHSSEKEHINKIGRRVMIGTAIVASPIVAFAGRVAYEEGRFLYNYLGGHEQRATRLDVRCLKMLPEGIFSARDLDLMRRLSLSQYRGQLMGFSA